MLNDVCSPVWYGVFPEGKEVAVMRLRLCASAQTIARMSTVWEVFDLPTQASRTKPWPRAA